MTPAKESPTFCDCNRDWVFRHTSYTEDGHAIGGKIICYTCGRKTLFDVSFRDVQQVVWRHESFGNGTWPIPDDAWAELQKSHAQRNEH